MKRLNKSFVEEFEVSEFKTIPFLGLVIQKYSYEKIFVLCKDTVEIIEDGSEALLPKYIMGKPNVDISETIKKFFKGLPVRYITVITDSSNFVFFGSVLGYDRSIRLIV